MDPTLAAFVDRLTYKDLSDTSPFEYILGKVVDELYKTLSHIPCIEDGYAKHGGWVGNQQLVQIHWPTGEGDNGEGPRWVPPVEMAQHNTQKDLYDYLDKNVGNIAEAFSKAALSHNFTEFRALELPAGLGNDPNRLSGALWRAPVRMVWDYSIAYDTVVVRLDILGKRSDP